MHFEFQNTTEDLWAANTAHKRFNRPSYGAGKGIFAWVLFIGLAIMLFMLLRRSPSNTVAQPAPQSSASDPGWWLSVGFLVLFCSFIIFIVVWGRFKHSRKDRPNEQPHQKWDIADSGVMIDLGPSRTKIDWDGFRQRLEAPTVYLLYVSEYSYHIVPKRAFTNTEQMAEFAALLNRHVQPRT